MTDQERIRFQAWLDSLAHDEREFAERSEGMPQEMAGVYATVELRREIKSDLEDFRVEISREISAFQRPWWKQLLGPVMVAGAFTAGLIGHDFKVGP